MERDRLATWIATLPLLSAQGKTADPDSIRQEVDSMLDADIVKAGLAVRYISTLFDSAYLADYEQSKVLEEEAEWARFQLQPLYLPIVPRASQGTMWWPFGLQRARILDAWDNAVFHLVAERIALSRDKAA